MTDFLAGQAPHEAERIAHELKEGSPTLGWRGDPRLILTIGGARAQGTHTDEKGRTFHKGDIVGMWFEVRRHNEDGTNTILFTRGLHQAYDIIPTLIDSDPRTPGFRPVMDRIEEQNRKWERDRESEAADAQGEMLEHMFSLAQERFVGRPTTRQVGGMDERPDRNLAKVPE